MEKTAKIAHTHRHSPTDNPQAKDTLQKLILQTYRKGC